MKLSVPHMKRGVALMALSLAVLAMNATLNLAKVPSRTPASSSPLLSTNQMNGRVDAELLDAIRDFESLGGRGGWFKSVFPELLSGQSDYFYLVKSLPKRANPKANLLMLHSEDSRAFLDKIFSEEKAPIIFGSIPIQTGVYAAAMTELQLAEDTLRAAGETKKKSILLLQPQCNVFILAHENQHWLDYENPTFIPKMVKDVQALVKEFNMERQYGGWISQIAMEIRGHAAQAQKARADMKAGKPYLIANGEILTSPVSELKSSYDFEAKQAQNIFEQAYLPSVAELRSKMTKAQAEKLATVMSKYDFSNDPENKITFAGILNVKITSPHDQGEDQGGSQDLDQGSSVKATLLQVCGRGEYKIADKAGVLYLIRTADKKGQVITQDQGQVAHSRSFDIIWNANPNGLGGAVLYPKDNSTIMDCDPEAVE